MIEGRSLHLHLASGRGLCNYNHLGGQFTPIHAMVILIDKMKTNIKSEWEVTDLREPSKIVRIKITMGKDMIAISSSKYIEQILLKEGLGLAD